MSESKIWSHEDISKPRKEFPQKHTPKSGVFLLWLLPCSANIWSAVDFSVQLIQKEPEELLCILLTGLNTEIQGGSFSCYP